MVEKQVDLKTSNVAFRLLMSMLLVFLLIPAAALATPQKAYAASDVYLEKDGQINYSGWFTAKMYTDGVPAICANPSKPSPPAGYYSKDYGFADGQEYEWVAKGVMYGGPWNGDNFEPDMWPSTWYDGSEMTYDRYVVCAHIVLADAINSDFGSATKGCSTAFKEWAGRNLVGYNIYTGVYYDDWYETATQGKAQWMVGYNMPDDFKIFQIAGGSYQRVISFDPNGWLQLDKDSTNPSITDGNGCYNMEGIQYGVYSDEACTNLKATLTCDTDGVTEKVELLAGTYWVKEIGESTEGSGYAISVDPETATVPSGSTNTMKVYDRPEDDPMALIARKLDTETGKAYPLGNASLEGAEFTVRYYDGFYETVEDAEASGDPTRTWVVKTNASGMAFLNDASKVDGDEYYRLETGEPCLPLGTILIQETKAPTGYLLGEQITELRQTKPQTSVDEVVSFNEKIEKEQVKRGDLEFIKVAENDMNRLAGVPFKLTSDTTGESHILVTDENGYVSTNSAWNSHEQNTNANDNATEEAYDDEHGIWFGQDAEGNKTKPNDELGALPYDTYTLEELPCSKNQAFTLLKIPNIVIKRDKTTIDMGTLDDPVKQNVTLMTTAYDAADLDKYITSDPNAGVHDTVQYMNLAEGDEYVLRATLMYADTGEPVVDADGNAFTGETVFTAEAANGKTSVHIPFDSRVAQGRDVVVYEKLFKKDVEVAKHEDKGDVDQQVRVVEPSIGTTATDAADGDKVIEANDMSVIKDTVRYTNLTPGKEYTMTGRLMQKAIGEDGIVEAKPVVDAEGNEVTGSVTFTPEEENGTVDVEFKLDTTAFEDGTELVAFELLYSADTVIAEHQDPEDEDQTVEVAHPVIGTMATDGEDGDKATVADPEVTIDDEVSYESLVEGATYEIFGVVMDKATGLPLDIKALEPEDEDTIGVGTVSEAAKRESAIKDLWDEVMACFGVEDGKLPSLGTVIDYEAFAKVLEAQSDLAADLVHAKAEFTAPETSGSTHVTFTFDASKWIKADEVTDAVVYELIAKDGKVVAVHADINDEGQTVDIVPSAIGTTLTDAADGDHSVLPSLEAKIVDTVRYENLLPGREYTMVGRLMDKETGKQLYINDKPVEQTVTFTANDVSGEVQVEFIVDTTQLLNKEVVAFESCSKDGIEVAIHADINDEAQTIVVQEGPKGSRLPQTGGDAWRPWVVLAILGAAAVAAGMVEQRVSTRKESE